MVVALLTSLSACSDSRSDSETGDVESLPTEGRIFGDMDDFVGGYWLRPIPLQGEASAGFSPLEASLQPSMCGTCHAQQYADWQTTVHASAYSPGLSGQLVNWEEGAYENVRQCLTCHTPLSEQSARVADTAGALVPNPVFDAELQRRGLVCAACHVRGWQRYGPPRLDGSLSSSPQGSPHGGVKRTPFFEDSRFCSGCHQFEFPGPNGKSIQNTYTEWSISRYAEEGVGCQGCHMPDRRHLWRGVHDSTMVRSGVTIEWTATGNSGSREIELRITNSGTGHRFPTYVTPEVWMRIDLLDAQGHVIDGASAEAVISREVEVQNGVWVELSDTRLSPDSSLTLTTIVGESGARFARGTVAVYPDAFYENVFSGMLSGALSDTSRALISKAHRTAKGSVFVIFDETTPIR